MPPDKPLPVEPSTRQILAIMALAGLLILALETVPAIFQLNYPFYVLFIFIHEIGHGIASWLTGGEFSHFVVFPGLGGLSYVGGGSPFLVTVAGTFSVALFTTILILLGHDPKVNRIVVGLTGLALVLISLRYGFPSIFDQGLANGLFTMVAGVILGSTLLLVARWASLSVNIFFQYLLVFKGIVITFADTWGIVRMTVPFFGQGIGGDVTGLAEMTHIPVFIWGLIWTAVAVVMFATAFWVVWFWKVKEKREAVTG